MLCTQTPGGVTEDEYVEMLLDRQVSGIVFVSGLHADTTADPERYRRLLARPLPIVLINGYAEGMDAPFISCDDRLAGELAVAHLVALGHRRIGLISGPGPVPARCSASWRATARPCAASWALRDRELDELVALSLFGVEGGEVAAAQLLEPGVTGIVCGSDLMALGAIRAARQRGLSVPGDVSVVGYDDSPLIAFTDPPLTTLRQPVRGDGDRGRPRTGRRDQRPRRAPLGVRLPPRAGGPRLHRDPQGRPGRRERGRLRRLTRCHDFVKLIFESSCEGNRLRE